MGETKPEGPTTTVTLRRGALYLLGEETVVFSRISGTGFAVVHPPGEPDMQSSWAVEPSRLMPIR